MGTIWELKKTPGEHHGNHFETFKKKLHVHIMGTFWEHEQNTLGTPKSRKIKIVTKLTFESFLKNKQELVKKI